MKRRSRIPFSHAASRYSRTTPATSAGRKLCRSSTPSTGSSTGSPSRGSSPSSSSSLIGPRYTTRAPVLSVGQRMTSDVTDGEERPRPEDRQAELQRLISRSALEWRLTFDAIASPLLLLEMDGRVLRMNEAARDLGGVSYEGAIHHPLAVLGDGPPWRTVRWLLGDVAESDRRASAQAQSDDGQT